LVCRDGAGLRIGCRRRYYRGDVLHAAVALRGRAWFWLLRNVGEVLESWWPSGFTQGCGLTCRSGARLRVGCGRLFDRKDLLRVAVELRCRAWFWLLRSDGRESRLPTVVVGEKIGFLCELLINFLQRPDGTAQLAEGVIETGICLCGWFCFIAHRSVVVVVGEWQWSVGARVRKGVGCRLLIFFAEVLPFLEKGGEVLTHILLGAEVVIAVEGYGSRIDCCFGSIAGRGCT